ncbi:DUF2714 domain-containing protein [Mycoplasmopsis caviae]|uniref:DUF2714 domain-containing protein n=1 Tax=Mycoplasmopsis caviae TaxID=55603 RepID=A0A3P8MEP4_9BACT|nr:DUF2714 domain-containing protein [Mycoplasmopsis caviae]UUD35107.1 DUF2714 domain-containing protein [Mycoplasmopsis caviae]VDR42076.1 Protein of uncharacterised function (DUF2714) [Mycoplasmopsis caviae]
MFKSNKKETSQVEKTQLFNVYEQYEQIVQNEKFINFEKFYATLLLENNLGFNHDLFKTYMSKIDEAVTKKFNLVFNGFVVSFNLNLKYSKTTLVPTVSFKEDPNTESVNFKDSQDAKYSDFLIGIARKFSQLLNSGFYIELLPNTVFYISHETKTIKLLFSKDLVAEIGE